MPFILDVHRQLARITAERQDTDCDSLGAMRFKKTGLPFPVCRSRGVRWFACPDSN